MWLLLFLSAVHAQSWSVNFHNNVGVCDSRPALPEVECDVLILGAGPAGTFAGYMMTQSGVTNVCVVERNDRVGGKIYSVPSPNGGRYPMGGARIIESQAIPRCIARDLNVVLQRAPVFSAVQAATRPWVSGGDAFTQNCDFNEVPDTCNCTCFQQAFLNLGPHTIDDYCEKFVQAALDPLPTDPPVRSTDTLRTYMRRLFSNTDQALLEAVFPFRRDWDAAAKPYAEFLQEEFETSSDHMYPDETTSAIPETLAERFVDKGGRLYLEEEVKRLDYDGTQRYVYTATTPTKAFRGKKLLIAIPPEQFGRVEGRLADELNAAQQMKDRFPVPVTVGAAWWSSSSWWQPVGDNLWRPNSRTTWQHGTNRALTEMECFNQAWIINSAAYKPQNGFRVAYDDGPCDAFWAGLVDNQQELPEEFLAQLQRAWAPFVADIPQPIATSIVRWPDGWYFSRPGTPFDNPEIVDWAHNPLQQNNPDLCLIGEAYFPNRAAWMDGAFKSVLSCLENNFPQVDISRYSAEECTLPPGNATDPRRNHWPNEKEIPEDDVATKFVKQSGVVTDREVWGR